MESEEKMEHRNPELKKLAESARRAGAIDPGFYQKYNVKQGLRESNGNGVLTGLTEISDVSGHRVENGENVPIEGEPRTSSIPSIMRPVCFP